MIDRERTNRVIRQIRREQAEEKFLDFHYQYQPIEPWKWFTGVIDRYTPHLIYGLVCIGLGYWWGITR